MNLSRMRMGSYTCATAVKKPLVAVISGSVDVFRNTVTISFQFEFLLFRISCSVCV